MKVIEGAVSSAENMPGAQRRHHVRPTLEMPKEKILIQHP